MGLSSTFSDDLTALETYVSGHGERDAMVDNVLADSRTSRRVIPWRTGVLRRTGRCSDHVRVRVPGVWMARSMHRDNKQRFLVDDGRAGTITWTR